MAALIYVAGSMKNRSGVLALSKRLRSSGYEVFNEWISPGEETDDKWREWMQANGMSFIDALYSAHGQHVIAFDKRHLDMADGFVLAYPAGKSGHTELGYCFGRGTPAFVLLDAEPERWDVMLGLSTRVIDSADALLVELDRKVVAPKAERDFIFQRRGKVNVLCGRDKDARLRKRMPCHRLL